MIKYVVLYAKLRQSLPTLSKTPWITVHWAPLSTRFSRQEHGSRLPFPSPRNLPNPGIKPTSLRSPTFGKWVLYHQTTSDIHFSSKNIVDTSYCENKQIKEQNYNNLESLFQFSRNLTNTSCHTTWGLNITVKKNNFVFQKLNLSLPKMSTTSLTIFLKNPFLFTAHPQSFSGLK